MKRIGRWNLLIALLGMLAVSGWLFGCSDDKTENTTVQGGGSPLSLKGSIVGLVVDVNNVPVSGATASLAFPGGTAQATTDDSGQYLFQNVPVAGQLNVTDSGSPYLITVQAAGFETTFTAALLNYAVLETYEMIETIGGELQVIGNLQVSAIAAVMRRPNATVKGYVVEYSGATAVAGALVTLTRNGVPDPWSVWGAGASEWSITANSDVTDEAGLFEIATVPEGTDASPVSYTLTISAAGFSTLSGSTVSVGFGTHLYWADANAGDLNPATAFRLLPETPQVDVIRPFATATNLPAGKIALANLAGPFTLTFNEAMRTDIAQVIIGVQGGAPIPVALSWSADAKTVTITPDRALPDGLTVQFELRLFSDVNGNFYNGTDPTGVADAFKKLSITCGTCTATQIALITAGDPTLMQASNLAQVAAAADPAQPVGGESGNVGQANNLNLLDWNSALGIGVIGNADGEANAIDLAWDAATPAEDGDGTVRYYKLYSEFATGGFVSGIPVFVAQTATRLDGNPDTELSVTLTQVETAIATYNAANPATDPDLPLVSAENGTPVTVFFDDGFTLNMAVTAVNSDNIEGPYSNVGTIGDNVSPTVADQGLGFDATTNFAIEPILVDLEDLDQAGGAADDNQYDADDYIAFAALSDAVELFMSEDLAAVQDVTGTLTATGGETLGACSVTNAEVAGGLPEVECVVNGIALVQQGDTIALTVTDETGNASDADAVVQLRDLIPALVASAETVDDGTNPDQIVLTMSEPVDATSAQTIANYTGVPGIGTATAALGADGVTVTITAAADGDFANVRPGFDGAGLDIAAGNVLTALVADLQANVQAGLGFQVVDEIAPRISSAANAVFTAVGPAVGDIRVINVNAAVASDGRMDVGDTTDAYQLYTVFTEPVIWDVDGDGDLDADDADALGLALVASPDATYVNEANIAPFAGFGAAVAPYAPGWSFAVVPGQTVAEDDAFQLTAEDIAGNAVNEDFDTVLLDAATTGYDID
ncbi:MAG: Ig-like domain-containing protein [bacterium]